MKKNDEKGFSLIEIITALAIALVMLIVGVPYVYNAAIKATAKTGLKSDVTAVAIVLAYNYSEQLPTNEQFQALKQEVLVDYYEQVTVDATVSEYFNGITYINADGYYCVQASDFVSGESITMSYNTLSNSVEEESCSEVFFRLN